MWTHSVEGVVLDIDDTLYLERDYVRSGFTEVGKWCVNNLGIAGVDDRAWQLFLNGRRGTTITDVLLEHGISAESAHARSCIDLYRSHEPNIVLTDDSAQLLANLRRGSTPTAIVTDGPALSQRRKIESLGLLDFVDRIVVTEEHGTSKPDPRVFQMAVSEWGLAPERLIYIADNPHKDFQGPIELGWQAARMRRPMSLHSDLATPSGIPELESFLGWWRKSDPPSCPSSNR